MTQFMTGAAEQPRSPGRKLLFSMLISMALAGVMFATRRIDWSGAATTD